jgi:hypothetical protein
MAKNRHQQGLTLVLAGAPLARGALAGQSKDEVREHL